MRNLNLSKTEIGLHLVFWLLSFWILLQYFAYTDEIHRVDLIYTGLFHLSLVFVFYTNRLLLVPIFFDPQRTIYFVLSSMLLIGGSAGCNDLTYRYLSDWLFPDYYFIPYYQLPELLLFHGSYWLASTLFVLSISWLKLKTVQSNLAAMETEKVKAELAMLKAQINPHFLFNSLHNIYSLTLTNDPRSSDMIVLLSEVLRYALYEARSNRVSLGKELQCLEKYLDIQRIRMPDRTIRYRCEDLPKQYPIAPLLLLPIAENAFKHGNVNHEDFYVDITLNIQSGRLHFKVVNSIEPAIPERAASRGGIGLDNLNRRLDLLYPDQYQLEIQQNPSSFSVTLNLPLNDETEVYPA